MVKGKTLKLPTAEKRRRLRRVANERRRDGAPPPVPRRSPCFGPCIVCNRYPKPGTKLKSAKDRLCKSCYNLKLREAKPKAKPKAKALNVELRRLRDRQRRQGIYSTGAQPLPRLTRAQSKAYEGLPVIAISSLFSAGGSSILNSRDSFIGTSLASMLNKCIVRLGVLHATSRRVDGVALRVVAPSETTGRRRASDKALTPGCRRTVGT